jgi:hypothetical protein
VRPEKSAVAIMTMVLPLYMGMLKLGNRESCVADDGSARRMAMWLLCPKAAVGGVEAARLNSRPHRDLRFAGAGVLIKC